MVRILILLVVCIAFASACETNKLQQRYNGATASSETDVPYFAVLIEQKNDSLPKLVGFGALIGNDRILTTRETARKILDVREFKVFAGRTVFLDGGQERPVTRIKTNKRRSLALVCFDETPFTAPVAPINLPTRDLNFTGETVFVAGTGRPVNFTCCEFL